ncbi:MAG TPA: aminomethyl-transferring glycine dehydrogenase subunit GcvPA [Thermomicrobiales bacterium]|nr:aminomethyl-transferring glycine dehydrogenase subunit GcvPA [Thermomicrobiales bacterium]
MSYVPHTEADRAQMLRDIGVARIEDLFADIPADLRFPELRLPPPMSEQEVRARLAELAEDNTHVGQLPAFLGAGAYDHYVPAVVNYINQRGEFLTAYTPYQPELSQGTLQGIYEYQTMVCQLYDMEVSNASMYDGATALAEGTLMTIGATRRRKFVVAGTIHPAYRRVLATYTEGLGVEIVEAPYDAATLRVTPEAARDLLDGAACLVVQYPNFFGAIEDVAALGRAAHDAGALFVVSAYPIAMGLLKPPGHFGADIAVGEGQCLGAGLNYGGPYLGLLACRQSLIRQMPGRLAGQTTDTEGRRGFVLTLQTREQHIRRERATSNICTNQGLIQLTATVYLALLGKQGLRTVAELCYQKAHYLARRVGAVAGVEVLGGGPFFNEFAVRLPRPAAEVNHALVQQGFLGGYDLAADYPELGDALLLCATETTRKADIDRLAEALAAR